MAKGSPWFHKFFQLRDRKKGCDIFFFNVADKVIQAAIDIIYGKEVLFPARDTGRLTWLLTKLEVKWSEGDDPEEIDPVPGHSTDPVTTIQPIMMPQKRKTENKELDMQPPKSSKIKKKTAEAELEKKHNDDAAEADFYSILDKFTETSDEELTKIAHMLIGEDGTPDRRYKCLKCENSSKFFTQAQKHHLEHEHKVLSIVRETLKKAELERQNDAQNIAKIEKAIGKEDRKKLVSALRLVY